MDISKRVCEVRFKERSLLRSLGQQCWLLFAVLLDRRRKVEVCNALLYLWVSLLLLCGYMGFKYAVS